MRGSSSQIICKRNTKFYRIRNEENKLPLHALSCISVSSWIIPSNFLWSSDAVSSNVDGIPFVWTIPFKYFVESSCAILFRDTMKWNQSICICLCWKISYLILLSSNVRTKSVSFGDKNKIALPVLPARAVRPTRCT